MSFPDYLELFITELVAELKRRFEPSGYTVEAREPAEGELAANSTTKQIFVTQEGFDGAEAQDADGGDFINITTAVMVGCVMKRPSTEVLAVGTRQRRRTLVQAVRRVMRDFTARHDVVELAFLGEAPQLIDTFYVSLTGVELRFSIPAEEEA
ncbi:hypothetical protein DEIPH_ctg013orf0036 [Deinococcus phoenicis]|uniref:Uncharacterized protein n=1 Tax=Deinococcus phoenicis TaxID=1476583 RepID=A0A016QS09_9DEIO|nr:hypothetical protein [Deinococcus phoenicis]EYB68930.1 hypothetical protein DEIPH_ctg013orf0036 [Deinococcus phoenicis]